MSSSPWMPLYIADYLADTAHLSAGEHGAYLLLIMHYWRVGKLPTDERQLSRIARMNAREWASARDTIAAFFDTEWRHSRIENEIAKSILKSNARAEYGSRGGKAKALKTNDAGIAKATILPEQNASKALASSSQSQSQSQSHTEGSSLRSEPIETTGVVSPAQPDFLPAAEIENRPIAKPKKPAKRQAVSSKRTTLPPLAGDDLAAIEALEAAGLSLDEHEAIRDAFRDYHKQHGSLFADWDAAWRTWVRSEVKFRAARQRQARPFDRQHRMH